MSKQRNLILIVCLSFFVLISALMVYKYFEFKRNNYRVGSIPLEVTNQLIPKEVSLESLRPPAIRDMDPIRFGSATSLLSVIEYGDFQCDHCRQLAPELKKAIAPFKGDVRFIWRDLPLERINKESMDAAVFARCAGLLGKYWETYDALMSADLGDKAYREITKALNLETSAMTVCRRDPLTEATIRRDAEEAQADGILSTPLIFVGTKAIQGFVDAETLTKEIKAALSPL